MKIYFDSCCYGRPEDNMTQARIIAETMAIKGIIGLRRSADYRFIGSSVVDSEIRLAPSAKVRDANVAFYKETVDRDVDLTAVDFERAEFLQAEGLDQKDSYHLAIAESAGVDVLITVDDDFERIATRKNLSAVRVVNPKTFLQEAINECCR